MGDELVEQSGASHCFHGRNDNLVDRNFSRDRRRALQILLPRPPLTFALCISKVKTLVL
jgi:hypothetical protein